MNLSMILARNKSLFRRVATIAAIILLLGQTIAASHFHRVSTQHEFSASSAAGIDGSSCAICAAQLHSPAASAVVPTLDAPKLLEASVVVAVSLEPLSEYLCHCFGRAPPASL
jgi:hypothetical protein